jgi:hypothetical protein
VVSEGTDVVGSWHYFTNVFVGRSEDSGASWSVERIADVEPTTPDCSAGDPHRTHHDLGNLFPDAALDDAGNIYFVASETAPGPSGTAPSHVLLLVSADHGKTFRSETVDAPDLHAAFAPAVVAGRRGSVDVAWLGSSAADETDPKATWGVYLAQTRDALAARPAWTTTEVAPDVHSGPICPTGCSSLHEQTIGLATDACGSAFLAWLQDGSSPGDSSQAQPRVARQLSGPRLERGECPAPSH